MALSNLVRMDLKCEHASIIGKKIAPFARAVVEIFNFFSAATLSDRPVVIPERVKFFCCNR